MRLPPRTRDWGPPTELDKLMEDNARRADLMWSRSLEVFLYRGGSFAFPYRLPSYKLRERAMYGGKKGRAAVRRLKARGCRPKTVRYMMTFESTKAVLT